MDKKTIIAIGIVVMSATFIYGNLLTKVPNELISYTPAPEMDSEAVEFSSSASKILGYHIGDSKLRAYLLLNDRGDRNPMFFVPPKPEDEDKIEPEVKPDEAESTEPETGLENLEEEDDNLLPLPDNETKPDPRPEPEPRPEPMPEIEPEPETETPEPEDTEEGKFPTIEEVLGSET